MVADTKTIAYILSAGRGLRLGGICKGRVLVDGKPLLARQISALLASGVRQIVVVCGHQAQIIEDLVAGLEKELALTAATDGTSAVLRCLRVPANQPKDCHRGGEDDGIQASVGAAIADVQQLISEDPCIDGVLIGLVDLPLLNASDIKHLLRRKNGLNADALIPTSPDQTPGHPIWLSRTFVAQIKANGPEFSLRSILRDRASRQPECVFQMKTKRPGYFIDLDTPDGAKSLRQNWGLEVRIP